MHGGYNMHNFTLMWMHSPMHIHSCKDNNQFEHLNDKIYNDIQSHNLQIHKQNIIETCIHSIRHLWVGAR